MSNNTLVIFDGGVVSAMVALACKIRTPQYKIRELVEGYCSSYTDKEFIIVCDRPPYFNSLIVEGYKSGRRPWQVKDRVCSTVREMPSAVSLPGFEADQIAGFYCEAYRGLGPIELYTLDTDWYQLQSDEEFIRVFDLHRSRNCFQTDASVCAYYNKKYKTSIKDPRQILDIKKQFGDKCDSLPPNSDPRSYQLVKGF